MNKQVFLDMDAVIADFDTEYHKLLDMHYSITDPSTLSLEKRWEYWNLLGDKKNSIFLDIKPFSSTENFVNEIIETCSVNNCPLIVLTALPHSGPIPNADLHKKQWIQTHLPNLYKASEFRIGPFTKDKWTHCNPGDIIIDDNDTVIADWKKAGGITIHHKEHFTMNSEERIRLENNSIQQLKWLFKYASNYIYKY